MSKRVYGLKRATPKMKYHHMKMMMGFRDSLQEFQLSPPDRHVALFQIEEIMQDSCKFREWYNEIYKLRSAGKQEEYEASIFSKLEEEKRKLMMSFQEDCNSTQKERQ